MRNFTQVLFLWAIAMTGYGQLTLNMELVSSIDNGETGNDIWGYVDSTGVEYAIMGTRSTTKIWSLEDPANPIERASIPGPSGTWRDIKSFEDHIYVTSDQGTNETTFFPFNQYSALLGVNIILEVFHSPAGFTILLKSSAGYMA